jgi:hypothetical protein
LDCLCFPPVPAIVYRQTNRFVAATQQAPGQSITAARGFHPEALHDARSNSHHPFRAVGKQKRKTRLAPVRAQLFASRCVRKTVACAQASTSSEDSAMVRCLLSLVALVLATSSLAAQDLSRDEIKEGFFNLIGKDFSGWRFSGAIPNKDKSVKPKLFTSALDVYPDNWKVTGGVIQLLKGGSPDLASQWDFDDFDLRLQWRAYKKTYNSGVYIRSKAPAFPSFTKKAAPVSGTTGASWPSARK